MHYRTLGKTGLRVSELCLGAMTFVGDAGWRHVGTMGQKEADACVGTAVAGGVNFFDTADIYSSGESERILGKALGPRRANVVIATKVGFRMGPGPDDDGCSRRRIIEGCHESLRRLGTEMIDLYQIHSFDPLVPLDETLGALNELVVGGKVRFIGCSNFTGWQLMKALAISRDHDWAEFVSLQALYSLLTRDLEYELVPLCLDQGLAILPWGPLAGGYLTGKYHGVTSWPRGTRMGKPEDHLPFDEARAKQVIDMLEELARAHGCRPAHIALRYLLCKPGITSLVFGARSREQLEENLRASDVSLCDEEMTRLDAVSKPPAVYPHWYFDIYRKARMEEARTRLRPG